MFSNLSTSADHPTIEYPITDSNLPFKDYITKSQAIIEERRVDLQGADASKIISANSPYEFMPEQPIMANQRIKHGVLLIHGLLDSPFSLRDIGRRLQNNGILCRSILLPGHGTRPEDMFNVSYHDWIQAVRYGIETLKKEVETIYLAGYSTGATLSVYHALHDNQIDGIMLLSPAIKIRAPVDTLVNVPTIANWMTKKSKWIFKDTEKDYAKYRSVTFNAPVQVSRLTNVIRELMDAHQLTTPVHMVISREDETISSHRALDFFESLKNSESKMLLYTSHPRRHPDSRVEARDAVYPALHINHLSHTSIPFAPSNEHYGQYGDFFAASRVDDKEAVYGAYSHMERRVLDVLHKLRLTREYKNLSYNPDFDYMANELTKFVVA